jgi:hypothetical protein
LVNQCPAEADWVNAAWRGRWAERKGLTLKSSGIDPGLGTIDPPAS